MSSESSIPVDTTNASTPVAAAPQSTTTTTPAAAPVTNTMVATPAQKPAAKPARQRKQRVFSAPSAFPKS